MKSILIVTGEASGDMHGANLVMAMLRKRNDLRFFGMGGVEMAQAGVDLLFDAKKVSVVGIAEVLAHLPDLYKAQKVLREHLKNVNPDLLIIIDLPDFNLMLAKVAKRLNIPVFYYISPQVWAWRTGRVKTIAERVDTVGVILPFEEQFMRDRGVDAAYVGHPLLDTVNVTETRDTFLARHGIDIGKKCIGLLPGSRSREVSSLLPVFLQAGKLLQEMHKEPLTFVIPLASTISENELIAQGIERASEFIDIHVINKDRYNLMNGCEAVVAASGTVTLELALLDVPMVVAYKLSPLTYQLGRMLVKLDHFSLVNLIAEREVVPELLQQDVRPETIADHLHTLLTDRDALSTMRSGLLDVRNKLGDRGASDRAADLALCMLGD